MKKIFFTVAIAFITVAVSAQYGYRDSNRIGIIVGVNQFSLYTSNFTAKPELGWNAGLSIRGNFYNDFDMVYAMQFSENNFSVATTSNNSSSKKDVDFKLSGAQISLQLSYKIVENHLSVELGPVFQVHGELGIDSENEKNTINGSSEKTDGTKLTAKDITGVSKFDFYPAVGITAGVRHFRANIQYQYGVTNMLGKLNNGDLGTNNFKANPGILSFNVIVYL